MNNFYWENYIHMYPELKKKNINTLKKAWNHYINFGAKENKVISKYVNEIDFDWKHYIDLYRDLKINGYNTKDKAWDHWIYTGKNEGRICASLKDKQNFDWESYVNYYTDLKSSNINTYDKAWYHWVNQGRFENRILFDVNNKSKEEINDKSKEEINDKSKEEINDKSKEEIDDKSKEEINDKSKEEINDKSKEEININKKNNINLTNDYEFDKKDYLSQIHNFCNIYSKNMYEIFSDPKIEFRYFCFRYLNYIRMFELPEFKKESQLETVLIEYRCFPHIEFLIRNTIHKLDENWAHTVICGNNNFDFVKKITNNISQNIKVINSGHTNLTQNEYSFFLTTKDFWNLLHGEKILIYQEDTCIFKKNIYDFINFDYIGAPWNKNQNDTPNNIGNGGLSLRSKQCMIDVINTISLEKTVFNSSTINYSKNVKLKYGPEDVYFSLNMQRYNIGIVADWEAARNFSSETIYNKDCLGGHNFWLSDPNWKERLYKNIIIQFKPMYSIKNLEHRGGWKYILNNLNDIDFYNNNSDIYFYDIIENYFLFQDIHKIGNKWAGVIHCTPKAPPYLQIVNIQQLFLKEKFVNSLKDCIFILTLSTYISNYLKQEFLKNNLEIEVYMIKHPVIDQEIPYFSIEKYIKNENKYLIQIGQQLRKMTSIFKVDINKNYKKLWLVGTKNYEKCKYLLNEEIKYLDLNINISDVFLYYTETFGEYDELLTKNIVFVDLFDAAANNTVIECIIRNTPIIINKIEGVVEYLGEDYPLYFNDLNDVNNLLSINNLINATNYLKNMNKTDLSIQYFSSKLVNYIIDSKRIKSFDLNYKHNILCIYTDDANKLTFDILKYFIFYKNSKVLIFTSNGEKLFEKKIIELFGNNINSLIKIYNKLMINEWIDKIDFFLNIGNNKLPQINGLANNSENNIFYCKLSHDVNDTNIYNTLSKYKYIILDSDFTKDIYLKYTIDYFTNQIIKIIYPCYFEKNNSYNNIKKDKSFVIVGNNKTFDLVMKYFEQIEKENIGEYILHIIITNNSNSFLNYLKTFTSKNFNIHVNISNEEKYIILCNTKYIINLDYEHFGISILEGINHGCIPMTINEGYPSYYINEDTGIIFNNEKEFYNIIYDIIINNKQYYYNYDFYDKFLDKFTLENYNNSIDTFLKFI